MEEALEIERLKGEENKEGKELKWKHREGAGGAGARIESTEGGALEEHSTYAWEQVAVWAALRGWRTWVMCQELRAAERGAWRPASHHGSAESK